MLLTPPNTHACIAIIIVMFIASFFFLLFCVLQNNNGYIKLRNYNWCQNIFIFRLKFNGKRNNRRKNETFISDSIRHTHAIMGRLTTSESTTCDLIGCILLFHLETWQALLKIELLLIDRYLNAHVSSDNVT